MGGAAEGPHQSRECLFEQPDVDRRGAREARREDGLALWLPRKAGFLSY
jgi:hypothetical protein